MKLRNRIPKLTLSQLNQNIVTRNNKNRQQVVKPIKSKMIIKSTVVKTKKIKKLKKDSKVRKIDVK